MCDDSLVLILMNIDVDELSVSDKLQISFFFNAKKFASFIFFLLKSILDESIWHPKNCDQLKTKLTK